MDAKSGACVFEAGVSDRRKVCPLYKRAGTSLSNSGKRVCRMNNLACCVEGELEIVTPGGPVRCVGTGDSFEVVFQNLRQLVRTSSPIRSGPAGTIANRLLAIARHAGIEVTLRIGERIVGDIRFEAGQNRPRVKLRFLNLAAAAVSKST